MNSESYADIILTGYPTAKMVHIIRDPRDRYASQVSHRGVGKGKVGNGALLWLRSVLLAERNSRKYPERYKVVRYETLVIEPESFLREICHFIGEEYSPDMLTIEQTGDGGSGQGPVGGRRLDEYGRRRSADIVRPSLNGKLPSCRCAPVGK